MLRNRDNIKLFISLSCTGFLILVLLLYVEDEKKVAMVVNQHEFIEVLLEDHRKAPTEKEIYENIARDLPSLPIDFWLRNRKADLQLKKNCAPYPKILELKYHNTYWQKYVNGNLTYYLYAAYYDKRKSVVAKPVVRILAMLNQVKYKFPREYCQMWFDGSNEPVIVPIKEHTDVWSFNWGADVRTNVYPHLVTCELPKEQLKHNLIPQTVSLVSKECNKATNNLRVTYEHPPAKATSKGKFAVCVKALWYPYTDMSARFIEWFEMLRILGAEKAFIYDLHAHPNLTRVLKYYKQQGLVDFPRITLGRGEPNSPHFMQMAIKNDLHKYRLNQVLQLNDCLYRNMNNYEYLAVIDIDEVIMPLGNFTNWPDLMHHIKRMHKPGKCMACHCFQNVYYPSYSQYNRYTKDIPKYMYMLQHVRRVREHVKHPTASKCFHNTNYVTGLHNHYPISNVLGCQWDDIKADIAQLQHYREPNRKSDLHNPVIDKNIWRFKDALLKRSFKVYKKLGFLRKINGTKTKKMRRITRLFSFN